MGRWYRLDATPNGLWTIEAALDRAMVEGYTRIPDDDELDGLAEVSIRLLAEEDPW